MNLDIKNTDAFKDSKKAKLSRKLKGGVIITALIVGIPAFTYFNKKINKPDNYSSFITGNEVFEEPIQETPINMELDEINNLNIIINNSNCKDGFCEEVCSELEEIGIKFEYSKDCKNVNKNNSVVISLEDNYISGPSMAIIAQYDNKRSGNSDALALACETAFYKNGFFTEEIQCGKSTSVVTEEGVLERVPTDTEKNISNSSNTSFVTLSFGDNKNASLVADSIKGALIRYCSYTKNNNSDEDLIYRAEKDDTLDSIANKLNTSVNSLQDSNDATLEAIYGGETFINPTVKEKSEFKFTVPTNTNEQKNKLTR